MMDALEKFIRLNSYKFKKGYPDINDPEDKKKLFAIVNEVIGREHKGYTISSTKRPVETLEDRNWYFKNSTGYLGTGYYFYGDLENAKQDLITLSNTRDSEITQIDLSQYKLYRPEDANYFYNTIRTVTQEMALEAPGISEEDLQSSEVQEFLKTGAEIVVKDLGLPLQEGTVVGILAKFIRDVREKNNGVLLSNRLLDRLGYEGIDNTNTDLDNYGVGSVLFIIKPASLKKLPIEK